MCTVCGDRNVCSCRHSKPSACVRSICYVWRNVCSQPSRCAVNWRKGIFVFHFRERTAGNVSAVFVVLWVCWQCNFCSHLTGDTDNFVYMKGYWCVLQSWQPNHHNWNDVAQSTSAHTHTHTHTHKHTEPFLLVHLSLAVLWMMFIALLCRRLQVALSVSSSMELSETKLSSIKTELDWGGGRVRYCYCQSLLTGSVSLYQTATVSVHCLPQDGRFRSANNSMIALRTPEKKHVARWLFWLRAQCVCID